MVARRAMLEGASFARLMGDDGAADWYAMQGKEIELELQMFWDSARGYFVATLNRQGGIDYKESNLDSSVLLGLLHGDLHDGFFSWNDPRVVATVRKIIQIFSDIYPINHRSDIPGFGIGRYPEDRYSGTDFSGGNPWPLCTLAVAESLYRYAELLASIDQKEKAQEMADYADLFVERVKFHAYRDGSLSEQMNRYTGYMQSASDLTWNYAALLTTRTSVLRLSQKNLRQ
jgi:glucoamylase